MLARRSSVSLTPFKNSCLKMQITGLLGEMSSPNCNDFAFHQYPTAIWKLILQTFYVFSRFEKKFRFSWKLLYWCMSYCSSQKLRWKLAYVVWKERTLTGYKLGTIVTEGRRHCCPDKSRNILENDNKFKACVSIYRYWRRSSLEDSKHAVPLQISGFFFRNSVWNTTAFMGLYLFRYETFASLKDGVRLSWKSYAQ